jgi:hypothetical protein
VEESGLGMLAIGSQLFNYVLYSTSVKSTGGAQHETEATVFLILFLVLIVAWLLGFTMFHVASALIHILLVLAIISIILHFVRGRGRTA